MADLASRCGLTTTLTKMFCCSGSLWSSRRVRKENRLLCEFGYLLLWVSFFFSASCSYELTRVDNLLAKYTAKCPVCPFTRRRRQCKTWRFSRRHTSSQPLTLHEDRTSLLLWQIVDEISAFDNGDLYLPASFNIADLRCALPWLRRSNLKYYPYNTW